ncbi:MAG: biotin carboxylase N-terminal domain-containing protein, partial [Gaiellaceae bacterium]
MSLQRVLVANRGEVAVRVVRACRELGIESVAVYSTADAESSHVRLADRAICIGPPPATQSYLDIPALIAAGTTTGCDAVHPGWGFLAENSAFARACEENELIFVGPRPETIDLMGDKVSARVAMSKAGVAGVPGSPGPVTFDEARERAREVGYPVLLKAAAGGGGKGMRMVAQEDELEKAFGLAGAEAVAAFGDGSMYLEKALTDARHVEIQVVCDGVGGVLALGERECSVQRRHQKLLEEAPSAAVTPEMRTAMRETAERACRAIGYRGAGTLEFLVSAGEFYFIEMNTRLQVEHPVTEEVYGVDLVREQINIALGEKLSLQQADLVPR